MKTNLDKRNDLQDALKKRDQEFIGSVIGPTLPEVFYTMEHAMNTTDFYRIGINTVTHAHYWHRTAVIWLNGKGKRPTTKAVEALKAYVEGDIAYKEESVVLFFFMFKDAFYNHASLSLAVSSPGSRGTMLNRSRSFPNLLAL